MRFLAKTSPSFKQLYRKHEITRHQNFYKTCEVQSAANKVKRESETFPKGLKREVSEVLSASFMKLTDSTTSDISLTEEEASASRIVQKVQFSE